MIEDNVGVRRALVRAVSDWAAQVVEVDCLRLAYEHATPDTDLVIADVRLKDESTCVLLEAFAQRDPAPVLVAISGSATTSDAFELAHLGVHAFVPKPFSATELARAVVHAIERRDSAALASRPQGSSHSDSEQRLAAFARAQQLSEQQTEVLRAVLAGTTRKQLASVLGVSENTCKTIVRRLLQRCGVARLGEIVSLVMAQPPAEIGPARGRHRGRVTLAG